MSLHNPTVDEIMQRVREEVQRRRQASANPQTPQSQSASVRTATHVSSWGSQPGSLMQLNQTISHKDQYTLGELLRFHDQAFVHCAYSAVLKRHPDADGEQYYLNQLRSGAMTKEEVLARLRYSPEGKQKGVKIRGLFLPFAVKHISRWPVIGYMVSLAVGLLRLPVWVRNYQGFEAYVHRQAHETNLHLSQGMGAYGQVSQVIDACQNQLSTDQTLIQALQVENEQLKHALDEVSHKAAHHQETWKQEFASLGEKQTELHGYWEAKQVSLNAVSSEMNAHMETIGHRLDDQEAAHDELQHLFNENQARYERKLQSLKDEHGDGIAALESRLGDKRDIIQKDLESIQKDLESIQQRLENVQSECAKDVRVDRISQKLHDYRTHLLDTQRRLKLLLEEARKRLPAEISQEQIETIAEQSQHALDAFYVSFEDRFRGLRSEIKARAAYYLPLVAECQAGSSSRPVIDLGCGRGEWLDLLREHEMVGKGVDCNQVMVQVCHELELDVRQTDALSYLRSLPDNSVGAVTSMHLVEHISFNDLIALFDECLRVMKPGGLVMLETPNPENITVGSCNFYMDPTHRNPIPPELLRYVAEARGFVDAQIHRLVEHRVDFQPLQTLPEDAPHAHIINPYLRVFHHLTNAALDYAVVARKA